MLSQFQKQYKKDLKNLSKKKLIQQILVSTDLNAMINISHDEKLEDTQEALRRSRKLLESYKHFEAIFIAEQLENSILSFSLKSAESAIRMYENMSVWQFLKHKFK